MRTILARSTTACCYGVFDSREFREGALRTRLSFCETAAQATALGYTIVTDKEREFARIEGLACENWLRPV
jgi:predicted nucleic acid-binding protein